MAELLSRALVPVIEQTVLGEQGMPELLVALRHARTSTGRSLLMCAAHAGVDALVRCLL